MGEGRDGAVAVATLIAAQRAQHCVPATVACRALGVSRSWFYKWKSARPGARAQRRQRLAAEVKRDRQGIPGVVIKPGQDLGAGPIRERVVSEAGLPALVGLLSGEPDVGGLRPLARLGDHKPGAAQVPGDKSLVTPGSCDAVIGARRSCPGRRPGPARPGPCAAR